MGKPDFELVSTGGVYVTLYGNFLGASPAVTLNGAACFSIVSPPATWMWYQKMTVQLTSTCASGNFAVTTASGTSNRLPFTVNAGKTYFVSPPGSDSRICGL